ncbi:hypothetical protein QVD17_41640 [Tagetes erecta]|uniref:Ubiquitin-like protease family profile domain-containing protein n=1 Tax=Tagetes erecta TaxID=13708 RepID=A0AAD8JPH9_TARER|nr:hypothetical protein QVD17_41640 [Tagetes erecta]
MVGFMEGLKGSEISEEVAEKFHKNWMVPQQQNAYDCGFYALLFIEYFIKRSPNRMETEYTTMFGKKWFQEKEVGGLSRTKMILKNFLQRVTLKVYIRKKRCGEESDDAPSNDDTLKVYR